MSEKSPILKVVFVPLVVARDTRTRARTGVSSVADLEAMVCFKDLSIAAIAACN
ncbi:hypothetical protein [Streptococcus cuniculi]|uniref:hypothetical protein n=1 Tax=Streptococcus cuniculi TaxID=1432788 RepID=UPI0024769127|nr:hypothetical protein [Streptococcus cuniculi]